MLWQLLMSLSILSKERRDLASSDSGGRKGCPLALKRLTESEGFKLAKPMKRRRR